MNQVMAQRNGNQDTEALSETCSGSFSQAVRSRKVSEQWRLW